MIFLPFFFLKLLLINRNQSTFSSEHSYYVLRSRERNHRRSRLPPRSVVERTIQDFVQLSADFSLPSIFLNSITLSQYLIRKRTPSNGIGLDKIFSFCGIFLLGGLLSLSLSSPLYSSPMYDFLISRYETTHVPFLIRRT